MKTIKLPLKEAYKAIGQPEVLNDTLQSLVDSGSIEAFIVTATDVLITPSQRQDIKMDFEDAQAVQGQPYLGQSKRVHYE